MIATPSPIPPPRPDDDEDVHWALSTASALWARGDAAESIKWLRRAAETASDQNRDQRSLELFKAAADATSLLRPSAPTGPLPTPGAPMTNPAPPAPMRPPVGPMGTISMQIPQGMNQPPLGPPPGMMGQGAGQGSGQSPPPPQVRPSAPMPPPQGSPPGRAPVPQRTSVPGAPPGAGGPPAGTARAAAAQANAQAQSGRPGFSPQRPVGSPMPAAVGNARQVLKATLPSEGALSSGAASRAPVPAARPSPGSGASAPSSAAKRADTKKQPLDARFHFPDEEVTVQRDLAALKRPRPVHTELAEDAAASAATQRAPAATAPPAARTLISTTAGSPAVAGAGGATVRGLQPVARAAEIVPPARHAIVNEATTAEPDHEHTPIDDLDEQTSVLAGDEAELEFEGSATGETSAAMLASIEQNAIERGQADYGDDGDDGGDVVGVDANLDEGVTGEESSDPRHGGLSAPSVRPDPMPRPAPLPAATAVAHRDRSHSAWTAVRVAVRRDASGVRVEALARGARPAPGAIAAVLVAQDDATADALAKLLDG